MKFGALKAIWVLHFTFFSSIYFLNSVNSYSLEYSSRGFADGPSAIQTARTPFRISSQAKVSFRWLPAMSLTKG